jgi:hypothetical protein
VMNDPRAGSRTALLLTLGRDVKSKPSKVSSVGNLAAFIRPLALEQFELAELQEAGEVVDVVARGPSGDLLALGGDRRQAQGLQVMAKQHRGRGRGAS